MNVFDQVFRGKFGMTIGCVHSTTGAMFRTIVP